MQVYCRNGVWGRARPSRGSAVTRTEQGSFLPAPLGSPAPPHLPGEWGPQPLPQLRDMPQSSLPSQLLPVCQSTSSHPSLHKALPPTQPK